MCIADNNLDIIVITRPDFFDGEDDLLNRLFENGLRRLHLRKPKASEQEMAEWIEGVSRPFRHRIVLHDHHHLANDYELGGIHLNGRNPNVPQWVSDIRSVRSFSVSRSCHSIDEVRKYRYICDYLFLSPIYDSISKEGYSAAFSRESLELLRNEGLMSNLYALGGVSPKHFEEVHRLGFYGAALLGAVWHEGYLL